MQQLVLRADASSQMGTGHIMRCLALAQAWQARGGKVSCISACENETVLQHLSDEGVAMHMVERPYPDPADWDKSAGILAAHPGAWMVLDGYHFDSAYQALVRGSGHPLLVIDDMAHLNHYCADLILNQNIHAERMDYECEPYTRLLLGTSYVLLRREFLAWNGWRRKMPQMARRVLVTMGGSDPKNVTLKVIEALHDVRRDGLFVTVVVGAGNPFLQEIQTAIRGLPLPINLVHNASNMEQLMAESDFAICGAGSTCWEMAFMGLPALVVVLADNQRLVAEDLEREGAARSLGWYEDIQKEDISKSLLGLLEDRSELERMALAGRRLVDGRGAQRVARVLCSTVLTLRAVREEDCRLLWEWVNDPQVRQASFSSAPIAWGEHCEWFKAKVGGKNCLMLMAMDGEDTPVGQVRFERIGDKAKVSASVREGFRGKGFGTHVIELACRRAFEVWDIDQIRAFVKTENRASEKAFRNAGFKQVGFRRMGDHSALDLALTRK